MSATEFIPLNWNPLYQNADKETKQIAYINPKLGDISSPIYSLGVLFIIFEFKVSAVWYRNHYARIY